MWWWPFVISKGEYTVSFYCCISFLWRGKCCVWHKPYCLFDWKFSIPRPLTRHNKMRNMVAVNNLKFHFGIEPIKCKNSFRFHASHIFYAMRFKYPIYFCSAGKKKCHLIPRILFVNCMASVFDYMKRGLFFQMRNITFDISLLQVLQSNIQFRRNGWGCHQNNL